MNFQRYQTRVGEHGPAAYQPGIPGAQYVQQAPDTKGQGLLHTLSAAAKFAPEVEKNFLINNDRKATEMFVATQRAYEDMADGLAKDDDYDTHRDRYKVFIEDQKAIAGEELNNGAYKLYLEKLNNADGAWYKRVGDVSTSLSEGHASNIKISRAYDFMKQGMPDQALAVMMEGVELGLPGFDRVFVQEFIDGNYDKIRKEVVEKRISTMHYDEAYHYLHAKNEDGTYTNFHGVLGPDERHQMAERQKASFIANEEFSQWKHEVGQAEFYKEALLWIQDRLYTPELTNELPKDGDTGLPLTSLYQYRLQIEAWTKQGMKGKDWGPLDSTKAQYLYNMLESSVKGKDIKIEDSDDYSDFLQQVKITRDPKRSSTDRVEALNKVFAYGTQYAIPTGQMVSIIDHFTEATEDDPIMGAVKAGIDDLKATGDVSNFEAWKIEEGIQSYILNQEWAIEGGIAQVGEMNQAEILKLIENQTDQVKRESIEDKLEQAFTKNAWEWLVNWNADPDSYKRTAKFFGEVNAGEYIGFEQQFAQQFGTHFKNTRDMLAGHLAENYPAWEVTDELIDTGGFMMFKIKQPGEKGKPVEKWMYFDIIDPSVVRPKLALFDAEEAVKRYGELRISGGPEPGGIMWFGSEIDDTLEAYVYTGREGGWKTRDWLDANARIVKEEDGQYLYYDYGKFKLYRMQQ